MSRARGAVWGGGATGHALTNLLAEPRGSRLLVGEWFCRHGDDRHPAIRFGNKRDGIHIDAGLGHQGHMGAGAEAAC